MESFAKSNSCALHIFLQEKDNEVQLLLIFLQAREHDIS